MICRQLSHWVFDFCLRCCSFRAELNRSIRFVLLPPYVYTLRFCFVSALFGSFSPISFSCVGYISWLIRAVQTLSAHINAIKQRLLPSNHLSGTWKTLRCGVNSMRKVSVRTAEVEIIVFKLDYRVLQLAISYLLLFIISSFDFNVNLSTTCVHYLN